MKFPWGRGYETVDFPTRHSRHIPIPHLWLSSCDGRLIPTTRGFASRGRNQSSITPATPCVGNWDVPFVTCGEIIFPTTRGFATRGRKYPVPYPLPQGNGTFFWYLNFRITQVNWNLPQKNSLGNWPNPFRRRGRDGKIPNTSGEATSGRNFEFPTSHERHIPIPHTWFSRRGGNIISTMRGEASSGRNYISTTTAKPQVGN